MKKLLFVLFVAAALCAIPWRTYAQPIQMGDAVATCAAWNPGDPVIGLISIQNANTAPLNVNWAPPMAHHSTWTRATMGQVFGIALDPSGNIYTTATSAYWPDAYGASGSGAVYKIDGVTGAVSTFATLPNDPVVQPSLGNICHDRDHNPPLSTNGQFFVTNFEDGKIYRINGTTGAIINSFDPFAADGGTAGFCPRGERIWGIAYRKTPTDNGRIYFARWREDVGAQSAVVSNEIHSIALDAAGNFTGATTLEITIPPRTGTNYSNPVSDIEFSGAGRMLLGERGWNGDSNPNPHDARVLEYHKPGASWVATGNTFNIGAIGTLQNAAGGVDYGYKGYDANNHKTLNCDSMVWATGDALHLNWPADQIYGLQGLPATGGGIAQSVLIDLDGILTTQQKTSIGDVDVYKNCAVINPCDRVDFQLAFDGTQPGQCCWNLTLVNNAATVTWTNVKLNILTAGVNFASNTAPAGWTVSPTATTATYTPNTGSIPLGNSGPLKFCLKAVTIPAPPPPQKVELVWYGKNGEICRDTITTDCQLPAPKCAELVNLDIKCKTAPPSAYSYTMTFNIKNHAPFSISNASLFVTFPGMGVSVSPSFLTFPAVLTGGTSTSQSVTIFGGAPGSKVCLTIRVCDAQRLKCCTFDTCFTLPKCDDCCDSLDLAFKNTKLNYNYAGNVTLSTQLTATPTLLTKLNATLVSATVATFCKGSSPLQTPVGATFTSGSFTTSPMLPVPTTWGTGSVTWGTYPPGATVSSAPLVLNIKFPPPPTSWKCRDTVRFCIRYTYTDPKCRTCDTTICYQIVRYGLIWHPVDHVDPIKFPFEPGEGGDDGESGKPGSGDDGRTIQSGPDEAVKNVTISMNSPVNGTMSITNPVMEGLPAEAAMTIVGVSIEPEVGIDLVNVRDNTTGQQANIVDRIASIDEMPQNIRSGETRNLSLTYNNEVNALAFKNYVRIKYTIPAIPDEVLEAVIVVYARTPAGAGGDRLEADPEISLTNVRTYGFKFTNANPTSDKICRVVVSIDPDQGDGDDIVAVGPGISRTQFGLKAFKTTEENPRDLLLAEEPSTNDADAVALDPQKVVTPIYVTVCGGDDNAVTFNYTTYSENGEVISTGTIDAVNPLSPGQSGVDDPSRPGVINSVDCMPNPLTNNAVFTLMLNRTESTVWLTISDLNGNIVATVLDGEAMIPGTHQFSYDLSTLPSGTYLYTLRTGTQTQTRKLQVIR